MECKHKLTTDTQAGITYCCTCGVVTDSGPHFVAVASYEESPHSYYFPSFSLDYKQRKRLSLRVELQSLCVAFQLPPHYVDQVMSQLQGETLTKEHALAKLCTLIRRDKKPITLTELCSLVSRVDPWRVSKLMPTSMTDPEVFLERHWQLLREIHGCQVADKDVLRMAFQLVTIAKDTWVAVGKRVEPVSIACLLIALSVLDDTSVLSRSFLCSLEATFDVSYRTLDERIHSIMAELYRLASGLPWLQSVFAKKEAEVAKRRSPCVQSQYVYKIWREVIPYIPEVIKWSGQSMPARQVLDPSCFTRNRLKEDQFWAMIESAAKGLLNPTSTEVTLEMLMVQRLLLHGHSVEELRAVGPKGVQAMFESLNYCQPQ